MFGITLSQDDDKVSATRGGDFINRIERGKKERRRMHEEMLCSSLVVTGCQCGRVSAASNVVLQSIIASESSNR